MSAQTPPAAAPSSIPNLRRPAQKRPSARVVTVADTQRISPNMIRLTLTAPELANVPLGCEGANCKILLPEPGEAREAFAARLSEGQRPVTRTYTVRYWRPELLEMDVDFVDHGDGGPASAFARAAEPGDFCALAGPGPAKITDFVADWYLVAADMSALPVAAAVLEAMPRDAKGIAIFEITSPEDRQEIDAPEGIEQHWLLQPDPHVPSTVQEEMIRELDWPAGRVQTCIAGESGVIKALRGFLHQEKGLDRGDTYISGYWKIGLVEDEHQKMKRAENA
ncbi:siderophore-interacting protein [Pseudodonghicola flavimaris]|uniref:Siderophore-interacting protein n=1 Tax=Pseudodonghicola flavimaris TaxID=3050036 RepID=A0ABT7F5D3_9RHOB|nr:siderophore-interacting protein [Pseudodonghicola flavimaris]MDK3019619.1 siderophore-interacting protein [Pseudodonghicola flavimaris]